MRFTDSMAVSSVKPLENRGAWKASWLKQRSQALSPASGQPLMLRVIFLKDILKLQTLLYVYNQTDFFMLNFKNVSAGDSDQL